MKTITRLVVAVILAFVAATSVNAAGPLPYHIQFRGPSGYASFTTPSRVNPCVEHRLYINVGESAVHTSGKPYGNGPMMNVAIEDYDLCANETLDYRWSWAELSPYQVSFQRSNGAPEVSHVQLNVGGVIVSVQLKWTQGTFRSRMNAQMSDSATNWSVHYQSFSYGAIAEGVVSEGDRLYTTATNAGFGRLNEQIKQK
jgi:hypothetical protein